MDTPRYVLAGGHLRPVLAVREYAPGKHPRSPIRNDLTAREYVTDGGSRWVGVYPDGSAYRPAMATRRQTRDASEGAPRGFRQDSSPAVTRGTSLRYPDRKPRVSRRQTAEPSFEDVPVPVSGQRAHDPWTDDAMHAKCGQTFFRFESARMERHEAKCPACRATSE